MKKICLVTSTRADYGIMCNLIKKLSCDDEIDFRLCVTGTHLSKKYGYTRRFIDIYDKYIDEIDILNNSDDTISVYSEVVIKFNEYFKKNSFDLVILLGDRYEIFCIASIAYINKVKMAHIHGGEITYGALDEQFRHCITKLSNIHFASCEKYRNRIIQMGESPENVHNVGSLSVENIKNMKFKSLDELRKDTGFALNNYALITFNPVTRSDDNGIRELKELINALSQFNYELIIMYPNMDAGKDEIISLLEHSGLNNYHLVKSLNYVDYLSLAKSSSLFIGNSSSGIIEIPSLGVPVINVGDRQKGREASKCVIECKAQCNSIVDAINFVNTDEYKYNYLTNENIYYKEDTSLTIIKEVKKYLLEGRFDKYFYDIK